MDDANVVDDDIEAKQRRLDELRRRVRSESQALLSLNREVDRLEAIAPMIARKALIGPAFVVGLLIGMPVWCGSLALCSVVP